jgi:GNAT superfamily N-acetyltransferase
VDEIRRVKLREYSFRRASGEEIRCSIQVLDHSHVDGVVALQNEVLAPLTPPFPLYRRDRAFFRRTIEEAGYVVGAFHSGQLIAYAALHSPGVAKENLGIDLGLPERELLSVAHLAGSAVHPSHRRNQLQQHLVEIREELARQAGFEHLCGEVIPGNSISIRNHLAVGYFLKAFRIDHLGEPNFVLHKELQREAPILGPSEIRGTTTDDIEGFRQMVNEGRWGFRTAHREDKMLIEFGRFVPRRSDFPARLR